MNWARARMDKVCLFRRLLNLFRRNLMEAGDEGEGLDSWFILEAELTERGNWLNVGHEVKRRNSKTIWLLAQLNWVHENRHLHHHQSSSILSSTAFIKQVCIPGTEINAYKHLLRCRRLRYKDICQERKSRVQEWISEVWDDPEIPDEGSRRPLDSQVYKTQRWLVWR